MVILGQNVRLCRLLHLMVNTWPLSILYLTYWGMLSLRIHMPYGGVGGSKPWTLGASSLKKVKAARRAAWALVERAPKTAPKGAVFCRLFTGA
jgi:hypothetical protein